MSRTDLRSCHTGHYASLSVSYAASDLIVWRLFVGTAMTKKGVRTARVSMASSKADQKT